MKRRKRRNASVMNLGPGDFAGCRKLAQHLPVPVELAQHDDPRRGKPRVNLVNRIDEGSRVLEDAGVRHNRNEFVKARPEQRPRLTTLSCRSNDFGCSLMKG